jgi:hypothetical protein
VNVSPNLSSIKAPKAEAKRVCMQKHVGFKEFSSGVHVLGKYEIEVRRSCYFIVLDAHKVAEIRARKCNSAIKLQQQNTRILERHLLVLPTSVRLLSQA